jgi:NAD(P)-dependent dehydrogenase (short-subunit alcohol dehydrogenase family)
MTTLGTGAAVVTGAASGIGRALAGAWGAEGMTVVLSDINQPGLQEAAEELSAKGVECVAEVVDVSDPAAVERLADVAFARFGRVSVVCNNAGVSTMGKQWEIGQDDWDWVIGVCLGGVVNGVRSFVPRLLAQGGPAHIVNTASMGGLLTSPFLGPYAAAKHAVVGLSKGLRAELAGTEVGVSVVCPGLVRTPILEGMRAHMAGTGAGTDQGEEVGVMFDALERGLQTGMPAEAAAQTIVRAVKDDQFWVLPNGAVHLPSVQADFDEMLAAAEGAGPGAVGAGNADGAEP